MIPQRKASPGHNQEPSDPNALDKDKDGIACEALPGGVPGGGGDRFRPVPAGNQRAVSNDEMRGVGEQIVAGRVRTSGALFGARPPQSPGTGTLTCSPERIDVIASSSPAATVLQGQTSRACLRRFCSYMAWSAIPRDGKTYAGL